MKKLTVALTTPPDDPSSVTTIRLVKAALQKKIEVYLYVTDDGVYHLRESNLYDLANQGVRLYVCAYGCQTRNLPYNDSRATYCGLVMLDHLIEGTDRFFSLN